MREWKKKLLNIVTHIDDRADILSSKIKQRFGHNDPVKIIPYRTYGTPRKIYVRGRVLEDKNIAIANEGDNLFTNLLNMYKRFESDEVSGAKVKIMLEDEEHEVITNNEGHFIFNLNPKTEVHSEQLYHTIELQLVHPVTEAKSSTAIAEIMIPPADAEYGIISDIDDTVIHTGATSLLAMGKTVY
ncbi:MAG: hypothetical protein WKF35_01495 [Ferruginibacter sp.]